TTRPRSGRSRPREEPVGPRVGLFWFHGLFWRLGATAPRASPRREPPPRTAPSERPPRDGLDGRRSARRAPLPHPAGAHPLDRPRGPLSRRVPGRGIRRARGGAAPAGGGIGPRNRADPRRRGGLGSSLRRWDHVAVRGGGAPRHRGSGHGARGDPAAGRDAPIDARAASPVIARSPTG